jgi:hypothetical protein
LLNLCAGLNCYDEFVNADFYNLRGTLGRPNFWGVDLRRPLKCPDAYWDGIFSEHTLEHLAPDDALHLLNELRRVLKVNAWLRIVVPDIGKYVSFYCGKPSHERFNRWKSKAAALQSVSHGYQHRSVWDWELLNEALVKAGFRCVSACRFGEGTDKRLLKDTSAREYESLYVEAQK